MRRILAALALLLFACTAPAQELTLLGGGLKETRANDSSSAWAVEYQQGMGENVAASFSWLNEGHVPGHHRDGLAVQLWGRANVLDRRLSFAAGIGPYRYFDTTVSSAGGGYANIQGWGTVGTLAATYYTASRWSVQLRATRVVASNSIDTSSLMLGVGYQLEPVSEPGPTSFPPYQPGKTTTDEITVFLGRTIVNSYQSENGSAYAIEYRHGLARHVDVTLGAANEGDARLVRRRGVTAQIWAVREVLASDRLALGIGFGPYMALERYHAPAPGEGAATNFSWIFTATASYRFNAHWHARFSWNRIDTNYNRDTDLLLVGIGYRI